MIHFKFGITLNDAVDFFLGTTIIIRCLIRSYLGAHYAERIDNAWVKRLFTMFMIFVIAKMVFSD